MAFIKAFAHLKKYVCLECVLYPKMKFLKHCSGPILVIPIGPSLASFTGSCVPLQSILLTDDLS